jgi:hypothetical protein
MKGTQIAPDDGSPQTKPEIYTTYSSFNGKSLLTAMGLGLFIMFIIFILSVMNRNSRAVRQMINSNTNIKLFGFTSIYISVLFYVGKPESHTCQLRI